MSGAVVGRRLALAAALCLAGTGCGGSGTTLPAATVLTSSDGSSVATIETTPSTDSAAIAPAATATETSTSLAAPTTTTQVPGTSSWVNATEGLVGLPSECGNLSRVTARPDRDMLITGIAQQGLWSTTGGTDAWSRLGMGPGSATITNRATTIIFDPADPAIFWESGIYNGGGVYRTDDNGVTFRQLGDLTHVEALSVDLSDPARNTLLATVHETANTFLSSNGGKTWKDISSGLPADIGYATGPVVIDHQTFLLGSSNSAGSTLLRSTDAGISWTPVYGGGVVGGPLRAQSDGTMYWLLESGDGIITSIDNGQTWALIAPASATQPTASALALLELPDARLAAISGDRVIISGDRGASWTAVGPETPIHSTGMIYSPFRKAFYIWHFECDFSTDDPIQADSIMRFDFDPTAG